MSAKTVRIPVAINKLSQAIITMKWRDQGWGNVKGSCLVQFRKGKKVLAQVRPFGPVTHKDRIVQYQFSQKFLNLY